MGRRWTASEECAVVIRIGRQSIPAIARRLGRTERAVRHWCDDHHVCATRDEWVTSGVAAKLTGYTPQGLTKMARSGRIRAHRIPGGRWWLFSPDTLPVKHQGASSDRRAITRS